MSAVQSTNATAPSPSSPDTSVTSAPPPAVIAPAPSITNNTSPPPDSSFSPPPPTASPPPPTISPSPLSAPSPPPPSSNSTGVPPTSTTTSSPPPPPKNTPSTKSSPPPPSGRSPPPSSSSPSSGLSTPAVVGIAVGGLALLVVITLLFFCCRKKKRRHDDEGAFYGPPPPFATPPKVDSHGNRQQQHWQQNLPPAPENQVMVMPKPSGDYQSSHVHSNSGGSYSNSGSDNPLLSPTPGMSLGFSKNSFSYEELARATNYFSEANLLGQGGFGYVHRGVLPNGKEVAVKQLKAGSGQGEREFQAEVEIISRVHHKHLVSLVGYCITGSQRLLVYEYVSNNTLEFHLHGKERPTMDWSTRVRIALGAARGLAYLHEDCHPKIIHRDIKASNILLDFKFEAKVADFGLAKFSSDANTHVSTRVMGTFGYLAPEYASSGKLTEKSDVFSYGVMLLELITGRRPLDTSNTFMDDSLVDWARPLLSRALDDGNFDSLIDPKLQKSYDNNEVARMVASAAACVRHSAKRRPRMSLVVRALEGDMTLSDLNEGIRPGHSRMYGSYGSSDYDSSQYNEDMKIFRKMALGSQEYAASSEFSEPTSQYGLQPSDSSSESQKP